MGKVVLQPTANELAYRHYEKTILHSISMSEIQKYVDLETCQKLKQQYPDGFVHLWGIVGKEGSPNRRKWKQMKKGDIVLFSKNRRIFSSAVVTLTLHNKELAESLWGVDENGNTWENIYFVEDIQRMEIKYKLLNRIVGYKENYTIRQFNVLNSEQSERLNLKFDLFRGETDEEFSEQEYEKYIEKLDNNINLDIPRMAYGRKEQAFLRNFLFGSQNSYVCGICGKRLPVNMLITSHIKKRSECSAEERRDYKNIVMPMCKLGCDDLYEKGYVYVQDGKIKVNPYKWSTEDLKAELNKLDGRECKYYTEQTKPYFEAHRKRFGIESEERNEAGDYR